MLEIPWYGWILFGFVLGYIGAWALQVNYDPIRFCQGCQKPQPRDSFVRVRGTRYFRCAKCAELARKRGEELSRGRGS